MGLFDKDPKYKGGFKPIRGVRSEKFRISKRKMQAIMEGNGNAIAKAKEKA